MPEEMATGGEQAREGGPEIRPEEFFYLKRQAEKMERELARYREREQAGESEETSRLREEAAQLREQVQAAERKAARATALLEAGLPAELAELVPEGDPEQIAEYTGKLKRLAERLAGTGGGTNTNPAGSGEGGRLRTLAAQARRGDERALREYAHLREESRPAGR